MLIHILAQAAAAATPEAAAQQGVISYPASYFAQYQAANAMDMINRIPGFTLDSGSGVRGYEGSAGNVLIDGLRPTTKTDNLGTILNRIPASEVERIDVIRGGAPGIDMQGKTVIANVIRKPGAATRLLVAASTSHAYDGRTLPAARFEASGDLGPRHWELSGFAGTGVDDGYGPGRRVRIMPSGAVIPYRIDSEGDILQAYGTAAVESPLAGGKLKLNGRFQKDKFKGEETDTLLPPRSGAESNVDVQHTDETEIGGNYSRKFGARDSLEILALRQDRERDNSSDFTDGTDVSAFDLNRETSETIVRGVLKHSFNPRLSGEIGAENAINKLDSETRFTSNGAMIELPAANVQVKEVRSEAFVKGAWRPTDKWTLDASVRYERSRVTSDGDVVLEKTLQYIKPRLAVAYGLTPSTQIRVRIEREVGQLNFNDFVASATLNSASGVVTGNPDINPEQAWVAEVAVEQRFWDKGSLIVTFTHGELKDVIDRGPVFTSTGEVFDRPANIGDGTKDVLRAEIDLPLDRLGLRNAEIKGDVTKRWSKVTDPTTFEKREISGLHGLDWNAAFTKEVPSWRVTYGVNAYGAWRETYYRFNLIETTKLHTYVVPFFEWRPRPDLNLRFEIQNATARNLHRTVLAYPGPRSAGGAPEADDRTFQPGRFFYFRVRKTFGG
jgi:outer membrane receptor protein involved in Fe transport